MKQRNSFTSVIASLIRPAGIEIRLIQKKYIYEAKNRNEGVFASVWFKYSEQ